MQLDKLAKDKARVLAMPLFKNVSRETIALLDIYVAHLLQWQKIKNLVAPSTLSEIWTRHIADSLQLISHYEGVEAAVDLGSGAGFPALIIAIFKRDENFTYHLVESNGRKCAFLQEAVRLTSAQAKIHAVRADEFMENLSENVSLVSARAFTQMDELLELSHAALKKGGKGVFLKGISFQEELTQAQKKWNVNYSVTPSLVAAESVVVVVHSATQK
jgi:16S rRNA (guanine527-N7)-methyltransferase